MTDTIAQPEPGTVSNPGTVALSTTLEPGTRSLDSGGGAPPPVEKAETDAKPEKLKDVLESEMKSLKAQPEEKAADEDKADAKQEDKPAKQRAEDGKFAKKEQPAEEKAATDAAQAAGGQEDGKQRSSEGRGKHSEPPARFLPEARGRWINTPNEVKAEVHRLTSEYEADNQRLRQVVEPLRQYDEMARKSGTTLDKAMGAYVNMENMLRQDFGKGVAHLAQNAGMSAQQAIGAVMKAYGATPAQVAQAAQQNPQAFNAPQARQQQPAQASPREAQLQRDNDVLRQQMASATVVPVIDAFKASRPDYQDLEPQIAAILKSGVIDQMHGAGLSVEQKLKEAYRMAGGQGPASQSEATAQLPNSSASDLSPDRAPNPDAGRKSVRGAPADGVSPATEQTETNLRDLLRKELRKTG